MKHCRRLSPVLMTSQIWGSCFAPNEGLHFSISTVGTGLRLSTNFTPIQNSPPYHSIWSRGIQIPSKKKARVSSTRASLHPIGFFQRFHAIQVLYISATPLVFFREIHSGNTPLSAGSWEPGPGSALAHRAGLLQLNIS